MFRLEFTGESLGCGRDARNAKLEQCGDIRIIADLSSMEIYLDGGKKVLSTRFYPEGENVNLRANGIALKGWRLQGMEVHILGK